MSADEILRGKYPTDATAGAWKKKAAVMAALPRLVRRGYHQDQGWAYLRGDDLLDAVRPLLAQHGLVPTFRLAAVETREMRRRSKGEEYITHLIRVQVACAFVDIETGERIDEADWPAETRDGDKAVRSAISMAVAAWLATTLLASAGEAAVLDTDPDGDPPPPPPRGRQRAKGPELSQEARKLLSEMWAARKAKNVPMEELEKAAGDLGYKGLLKECGDPKIINVLIEVCNQWPVVA